MNRREKGNRGEDAACRAMEAAGIDVLERNYRRPGGEIDIIAREGATVLFVEVKARDSLRFGRPAEAVDRVKQRRIVHTAMRYLAEHRLEDVPVRFDVIEVLPDGIRHLRDAFDATGLL